MECDECDLVYLERAPTPDGLSSFYTNYYSSYRSLTLPTAGALRAAALRGELDPLTAFALQSYGRIPSRVADIGCGQGARLLTLQALGARSVVGTELDASAAEKARALYGVDVRVGGAQSISTVNEEPFDVVFLSEVIEHVVDPISLLMEVAPLVRRDGGLLCLSTPNSGVRHRARAAWAQLHRDFDHVTLFSSEAMRRALGAAKLRTVETLAHGIPAESGEYREMAKKPVGFSTLRRIGRVASRVYNSSRSRAETLAPQAGYTLLVSACHSTS